MIIVKIYTSYFGNIKKIPNKVKKIAISKYIPKGITCDIYSPAAPPSELLKAYKQGGITDNEYIQIYKKYLNSLNGSNVVKHLKQLAGGSDIALLCYEKPNDFCHRHLFLEWLSQFIDDSIIICGEATI